MHRLLRWLPLYLSLALACGSVQAAEVAAPGADLAARKQLAAKAQADGRYRMAWQLLLPIAESGDADAAYQMGWLCELGWEGVPPDMEQATSWYHRAAERGHVLAQLWLGYRYAGQMAMDNMGYSSPDNFFEGMRWLEKAAAAGNVEAQLLLGDIYSMGRGPIRRDDEMARRWLTKAAEQGNPVAQIMLRTPQK